MIEPFKQLKDTNNNVYMNCYYIEDFTKLHQKNYGLEYKTFDVFNKKRKSFGYFEREYVDSHTITSNIYSKSYLINEKKNKLNQIYFILTFAVSIMIIGSIIVNFFIKDVNRDFMITNLTIIGITLIISIILLSKFANRLLNYEYFKFEILKQNLSPEKLVAFYKSEIEYIEKSKTLLSKNKDEKLETLNKIVIELNKI